MRVTQEIDKLAWLRIKDKQVLGARSKGKDAYYIPGGKREPGESDEEALIREVPVVKIILDWLQEKGMIE
jgi:8-oxo-dGTP diphosphatase